MMILEEDTSVVVEVGFHNHCVQRRGYHDGRAGHGSRGELFPVEFQVPNRGARPCALVSAVRFVVFEIGRIGAHSHVARLCHSSSLLLRPCMQKQVKFR
ncbi:hypothetical protein GOBAR_AA09142 [Gossypium barbadense]|uniref:Uncharacterized protein n=1 Tax=Gossypium barbadense TaxID=3634 RepID=A0A2P5Y7C8_GOSBA|nr:hypothetical protein GOBAR_AA09142 [Gossypium barbadense]